MLDPIKMNPKKLSHVLEQCLNNIRKEKALDVYIDDNIDCNSNLY